MTVTNDLMFGLKNYGGILLSPQVHGAITATEEGRQYLSEMQELAKFIEMRNARIDQRNVEGIEDLLKMIDNGSNRNTAV